MARTRPTTTTPTATSLNLTNYAPNGTVNSSFSYTYNALGLETSETTIDGTWTYGYDADGQLISAAFAPNSTDPDGLTAKTSPTATTRWATAR